MVGVYLSVWVRRGILQHVRGVQVTYVGTGMMGYLGNKGQSPWHSFCCAWDGCVCLGIDFLDDVQGKTRKEKIIPFGMSLMRSQVLYRAAQISGAVLWVTTVMYYKTESQTAKWYFANGVACLTFEQLTYE